MAHIYNLWHLTIAVGHARSVSCIQYYNGAKYAFNIKLKWRGNKDDNIHKSEAYQIINSDINIEGFYEINYCFKKSKISSWTYGISCRVATLS